MGIRSLDSFNRANSSGLGDPDVGFTWIQENNGGSATKLGISSNKVASPGDGSNTTYIAYQDGGATPSPSSPTVIELIVDTIQEADGSAAGMVFRYADVNNYWRWIDARPSLSTVYLQKQVAGGFTTVQAVSQSVANGDILRIEDDGTNILAYHNGVLKYTAADNALATNTKSGMTIVQGVGGGGTLWRLDSWKLFTRAGRYGVIY